MRDHVHLKIMKATVFFMMVFTLYLTIQVYKSGV